MNLRSTVKSLLGLSLGAPVLVAILVWVRVLLGAMGDPAGARIADRVTLGVAVVWLAGLAALVVALAAVYLDVTSAGDECCEHEHEHEADDA
ncbi:MAG: hypothetical protein KF688_13465 [Pirellulales bacterium]|nr:hypothetical protein [Pirellulales bacterium]MBX3434307.1 hypothetical protein [Pirellulales bacterium]